MLNILSTTGAAVGEARPIFVVVTETVTAGYWARRIAKRSVIDSATTTGVATNEVRLIFVVATPIVTVPILTVNQRVVVTPTATGSIRTVGHSVTVSMIVTAGDRASPTAMGLILTVVPHIGVMSGVMLIAVRTAFVVVTATMTEWNLTA